MQLLSMKMLAKYLSLSTQTVKRLRRDGKLPEPVRVGGSLRWRDEEITDWIAAGCPEVHERDLPVDRENP